MPVLGTELGDSGERATVIPAFLQLTEKSLSRLLRAEMRAVQGVEGVCKRSGDRGGPLRKLRPDQ